MPLCYDPEGTIQDAVEDASKAVDEALQALYRLDERAPGAVTLNHICEMERLNVALCALKPA